MNETGLPTPAQVFARTTFDAIIFDMDGTLISSIQSTERAWGTWMTFYGMDPDHYHQFHGVPAAQIVAQVLPPELQEEGFNRIVNLELTDTDGIVLLPGAGTLWHSIDPQRRAIATSCVRNLAEVRMEITGLATPIVVTADDVADAYATTLKGLTVVTNAGNTLSLRLGV